MSSTPSNQEQQQEQQYPHSQNNVASVINHHHAPAVSIPLNASVSIPVSIQHEHEQEHEQQQQSYQSQHDVNRDNELQVVTHHQYSPQQQQQLHLQPLDSKAIIAFLRMEAKQLEERARSLRDYADKLAAGEAATSPDYELAPLDEHGIPKYKGKKRGRKPKKRKRVRNPNAPKRKHTAYTLYVQETYPKLKKEYPQPKFQSKDLIAMVAKQWKEMSDQEKKVWKERAKLVSSQEEDDEHEDEHEVLNEDEDLNPNPVDSDHANNHINMHETIKQTIQVDAHNHSHNPSDTNQNAINMNTAENTVTDTGMSPITAINVEDIHVHHDDNNNNVKQENDVGKSPSLVPIGTISKNGSANANDNHIDADQTMI